MSRNTAGASRSGSPGLVGNMRERSETERPNNGDAQPGRSARSLTAQAAGRGPRGGCPVPPALRGDSEENDDAPGIVIIKLKLIGTEKTTGAIPVDSKAKALNSGTKITVDHSKALAGNMNAVFAYEVNYGWIGGGNQRTLLYDDEELDVAIQQAWTDHEEKMQDGDADGLVDRDVVEFVIEAFTET